MYNLNNNKYFEYHWSRNNKHIPVSKISQAKQFLGYLIKLYISQNRKLEVIDVGCGDGVHATVIGDILRQFNYTGIDISRKAIDKCQLMFKGHENISFEIGDINKLKYDDNSFDIVFSYGVIAYMLDPKIAMKELSRVVRPNGLIGIWVFPRPERIKYHIVMLLRLILTKLPMIISISLLNVLVPLIGMMATNSKVSLKNASWEQCREILMVNLLPANLILPTEEDVEMWFRESHLSIVSRVADMPITIWAKKC